MGIFYGSFYIYPETVAKVKFERNLRKNPGYKGDARPIYPGTIIERNKNKTRIRLER